MDYITSREQRFEPEKYLSIIQKDMFLWKELYSLHFVCIKHKYCMYFAIQVKKAVYMYTVNFLPEGHTACYIGRTVHCTVYIISLKAVQPVISAGLYTVPFTLSP